MAPVTTINERLSISNLLVEGQTQENAPNKAKSESFLTGAILK